MFLSKLSLYQFRNLADATLEFSPGVNVVLGKNAQGKTNLIEAISLLGLTRSFRGAEIDQLVRWGSESGSVFGTLVRGELEDSLGVSIDHGKRSLFVNGEQKKSISDFVGKLVCVSFSPQDLLLIQGAPALRRRFLDKHLVDLSPILLRSLVAYDRAIKSKNKILKSGTATQESLEVWNRIVAIEGAQIISARRHFIEDLAARAAEILKDFAISDAALTLRIKSSLPDECADQEILYEKLVAAASREIFQQVAVIGPHRDDLQFFLGGNEAKSYASQGQIRSIVLSLVLALIELLEKKHLESPLVLLDDVNSELDGERRDGFFEHVLRSKRQIFVTGTDVSVSHLSAREGFSSYRMREGAFERVV